MVHRHVRQLAGKGALNGGERLLPAKPLSNQSKAFSGLVWVTFEVEF